MIRQIAHHGPRCLCRREQIRQGVGLDDLKPRSVCETLSQQWDEITISLDGHNSLTVTQQTCSQVTEPCADLEDRVLLKSSHRGTGDLVLRPLVMEKILPPGFFCPKTGGKESFFGVAQTSLCLAR